MHPAKPLRTSTPEETKAEADIARGLTLDEAPRIAVNRVLSLLLHLGYLVVSEQRIAALEAEEGRRGLLAQVDKWPRRKARQHPCRP